MKKVEIIIGSPRKIGNTTALANQLGEIVDKNGGKSHFTFLYDYKIKPCIDCRFCKTEEMKCLHNDDAKNIFNNMESADTIVFGTPIYWSGPTATMKLLIDRLRPYYANKKLTGKKAALLLPAGDGEIDCDLTEEMYKRITKALGVEYIGAITAKAHDIGDIKQNEHIEGLEKLAIQILAN